MKTIELGGKEEFKESGVKILNLLCDIDLGKKSSLKYLLKHSEELYIYHGKCVSIVKDILVAIGWSSVEVNEKAREK